MLNTIYDILGIIIGILATIVLVDETVIKIKNKNKDIKRRAVFIFRSIMTKKAPVLIRRVS